MQALLDAMGRNKKKTILVAFLAVVLAFVWHNTPAQRYRLISTEDTIYELDTMTGELWQVHGLTRYKVREQKPEDLVGKENEIGDEQKKPTADENEFTHVIASDAVYYVGGPQQAQPPDGTFTAGTKVLIIEEAGSYSLIRSEEGIEAYVAADVVMKREEER